MTKLYFLRKLRKCQLGFSVLSGNVTVQCNLLMVSMTKGLWIPDNLINM